jgi:class 3 adenylate cyclase/tetratricopeptide (TPR) repeat protein
MEGTKMQCPKCQFENPVGVNFCVECGNKLEKICSECGYRNSLSYKFCGGCGYKLSLPVETPPKDLSLDEKLTKIQRYLPKGLTEKILSQRDRIEGERKQVTVMFCDMEGFTHLTESLGPEKAYSIMDQVYEILIHKVHDYEGTVNEMTGDGIMALFGAPIALEDAPQRAIRSAYAIHREMVRYSDKLKSEKILQPIKMRIGIHTGPVVVGALGNDLRVEFKAVGDTVNLASRMEDLAEPGATYVTEETFKLTEGLFRFEALGERQVKGKEKPVKTFRVIAPSTRRTRFDVSAERGLTPFVGRERELELLLDGFDRAKAGRGQAFSIISEAGVGKSRLLYEFIKSITNEDVTIIEGKCLSYSQNVAYHPVVDILKSNFDIREEDGDLKIREKVKRGLKILGTDEASTLPYLLELLSVKDSGIDKIHMSPEARKDSIIEAFKRIVLKGSEIRPLIMAIEDLHWMDKSSEDSFKDLLDSITGARVFLIFTYRPQFVHAWGGKSYHSQVTLNRLSNRESLAMVTYLLGTENIDSDLEKLILEKTEGVPFFIEEFLKSLIDLSVIERKNHRYHLSKNVQHVTIASTIQDVIMARVDSLSEGAKEVLQIGSVIEREFSYELIKQLIGLKEKELLSHLSVIRDAELLYERGIYPQSTYIFKHALTREVIYDSILIKKRKRLHEEIGKSIEYLNKDNISEHYERLADHFVEAERYEKGAEYSDLAAKKALKAASFKEAIEYARKRVACFERLPVTDSNQRKIIDARTVLAGYFINLAQIAEANDAVAPIAELVIKMNYRKRLPAVYNAVGLYNLWGKEDYSKASKYLHEVINISEEEKDYISLWMTCLNLGWNLSYNCEFEKGLKLLRRALDLSLASKNLMGIEFCKNVINSMNYLLQGKIDFACRGSSESLELAEKSGDIFLKGISHCSYGTSCYFKGFFEKAKDYLVKGWNFCEKANHIAWGTWVSGWLGNVFTYMEEYNKANDYYKKAISISEDARLFPSTICLWKVSAAWAKVLNNDQDINMNVLLRHYEDNKLRFCKGLIAKCIGEILMNIEVKESCEAGNWVMKAIGEDTRNGTKWFLANDYAVYAEFFKRKGDQSKAKENIGKAIEIFKECGADGWVAKYKKELAELE